MSTRFPKVLVGVDGRQGGRDAIALARVLAAPDSRLVLGHAWTLDALALEDRSHEALELLGRERERTGVEATIDQAGNHGTLAALQELVDRHHPDLVVLGTSHRSALGRHLVGDVGRAALHRLDVPVAFAPAGYADDLHRMRTIGIGFDDTPSARAALETARALAAELGGSVRGLTVVDVPRAGINVPGSAPLLAELLERDMDEARARLRAMPGIDGHVTTGPAGIALRDFSRTVDLLVLGSRGRGAVTRTLLGSTADALVHHAACPLLVLPPVAGEVDDPRTADAHAGV